MLSRRAKNRVKIITTVFECQGYLYSKPPDVTATQPILIDGFDQDAMSQEALTQSPLPELWECPTENGV